MNRDLARFSVIVKEVKVNFNVFGLCVLHRVLRDGDCTCVVAEDRERKRCFSESQ